MTSTWGEYDHLHISCLHWNEEFLICVGTATVYVAWLLIIGGHSNSWFTNTLNLCVKLIVEYDNKCVSILMPLHCGAVANTAECYKTT